MSQKQKESHNEDKDKSVKTGVHSKQDIFLSTPQKSKPKQLKTTEKSNNAPLLDLQQKNATQQRGCNCRKSQCLKMYCVCFSSGKMCEQGCLCDTCYNKTDNMLRSEAINQIITRDPFAFSRNDNMDLIISGQGCNCKRSNCTKKYCECYRKGRGCGETCNCIDCQNMKKANPQQEKSAGSPKKRVKLQ